MRFNYILRKNEKKHNILFDVYNKRFMRILVMEWKGDLGILSTSIVEKRG